MSFLDFPSEILTLILLPLDLRSLISCISISRRIKAVIDGSALLQYRLASQVACVDYIPPENTHTASADRTSALNSLQDGLAQLLPSSTHTIQMDVPPSRRSSVIILAGGILALTEPTRTALRSINLASLETHPPTWERLELTEYIYELASLPEEDLLILVTSTLNPDNFVVIPGSDLVYNLRFYQLSTLSPHDGAPKHTINLPIIYGGSYYFDVDCCETKVSVAAAKRYSDDPHNHLWVYDWKTGRLHMDIFGDTAYSAYMLPAHILLLPQSTQGALELWAIQDSPNYQSGPELFLLLPTLERAPGFQYLFDKVEYTPKGHCPTNRGSQRFHSSYDESVLAFDLTCGDVEGGTMCLKWLVVISRKALLQLLSLSENPGAKLTWDQWIPFTSRWLLTDGVNYTWPTNICGQRIVFVTHEGSILLLDFNQHRCGKNLRIQAGDEEEPIDDEDLRRDPCIKDEPEMFGESAHRRLEYVVKTFLAPTDWRGVMLDEDWIVGFKDTRNADGRFTFEVWRFG